MKATRSSASKCTTRYRTRRTIMTVRKAAKNAKKDSGKQRRNKHGSIRIYQAKRQNVRLLFR